jgi:hypothetical protein
MVSTRSHPVSGYRAGVIMALLTNSFCIALLHEATQIEPLKTLQPVIAALPLITGCAKPAAPYAPTTGFETEVRFNESLKTSPRFRRTVSPLRNFVFAYGKVAKAVLSVVPGLRSLPELEQ